MFNSEKWNKLNLDEFKKYQNDIYIKHKSSNSINQLFDLSKHNFSNNGRLKNIPFSIKSNYAVKDVISSASSNFLKSYTPNYSSYVYEKLTSEGAICLFNDNLDELAMGGTGFFSNAGIVKNPFDQNRMIGGSSSGGAYNIASGIVEFSIASDTGDSVRKPAAYVGKVGYKPTWDAISRKGLYDFSPSLDTVSYFTNTVKESALLFEILANKIDCVNSLEHLPKLKFGFFKNLFTEIKDLDVLNNFNKTIEKLKHQNVEFVELELDKELSKLVLPSYLTISSVEAFSCNSNLSGLLFGENESKNNFESNLIENRTKNLGYEVKKRFLFGNYAIHETDMYTKSLKYRTILINKFNELFSKVDGIIMPAAPTVPPLISGYGNSSEENILEDYLTIFNLIGSPSITVPNFDKTKTLPTAINISTKPFEDKKCLQMAHLIETTLKG